MRSTLAATLLCAALCHSDAWASTPELAEAVNRAIPWNARNTTPAQRKDVALALLRYWTSFLDRIPRLSPAEAEWLSGELRSTDRNRLMATFERREYALREIIRLATNCEKIYGIISETKYGDPRQEAASWVSSIECTRNHAELLGQLRRANVSGSFAIDWLYIWEGQVIHNILPSILIPQN